MASNFIYSATNAQPAAVTVLRFRARVPAKRKSINWHPFQVKTMSLERKSGSTW